MECPDGLEGFLREGAPQSLTAVRSIDYDATERSFAKFESWRKNPAVSGELSLAVGREVERHRILAITVCIRAVLLDDKDSLAKREDLVELEGRELVKPIELPLSVRWVAHLARVLDSTTFLRFWIPTSKSAVTIFSQSISKLMILPKKGMWPDIAQLKRVPVPSGVSV